MKLDPDAEWWMALYLPLAIPLTLTLLLFLVVGAVVWGLLILPVMLTMGSIIETVFGPR